jgi:hypothetical protein
MSNKALTIIFVIFLMLQLFLIGLFYSQYQSQQETNQKLLQLYNALNINQLDKLVTEIYAGSQRQHDAIQLAKNAQQNDDIQMAQLLYLNAYHANNAELTPLAHYTQMLLNTQPDVNQLTQLKDILESASYHINPSNINQLLELLSQVQQHIASEKVEHWQTLYAQINETPLTTMLQNLNHYWQQSQMLLQLMNEQPNVPDIEYRTIQALTSQLQSLLQTSLLLDNAEQQLQAINQTLGNNNTVGVVYRLNIVENNIAQIFTQKQQTLSQLQFRIEQVLTQTESAQTYLSELIDIPKLASIKQIVQTLEEQNEKQDEVLLTSLKNVTNTFSKINNSSIREQAHEYLEILQARLAKVKRDKQFDYNRWVIARCHRAFKEYQAESFVSDEDAVRIFKFYDLQRIDQSLLSPEVSRVYMEVLHKLMAKMSVDSIVWVEEQLALAKKKTLGDF